MLSVEISKCHYPINYCKVKICPKFPAVPSSRNEACRAWVYAYDPRTWDMEVGESNLEASLSYMKPSLQQQQTKLRVLLIFP